MQNENGSGSSSVATPVSANELKTIVEPTSFAANAQREALELQKPEAKVDRGLIAEFETKAYNKSLQMQRTRIKSDVMAAALIKAASGDVVEAQALATLYMELAAKRR